MRQSKSQPVVRTLASSALAVVLGALAPACAGGGGGSSTAGGPQVRGVAASMSMSPIAFRTASLQPITASGLTESAAGLDSAFAVTDAGGAFSVPVPQAVATAAYGGRFYRLTVAPGSTGGARVSADIFLTMAGLDVGMLDLWEPVLAVETNPGGYVVGWAPYDPGMDESPEGYEVELVAPDGSTSYTAIVATSARSVVIDARDATGPVSGVRVTAHSVRGGGEGAIYLARASAVQTIAAAGVSK